MKMWFHLTLLKFIWEKIVILTKVLRGHFSLTTPKIALISIFASLGNIFSVS